MAVGMAEILRILQDDNPDRILSLPYRGKDLLTLLPLNWKG